MEALWGLAIAAVVLGPVVLAIVALVSTRRLNAEVTRLRDAFGVLEAQIVTGATSAPDVVTPPADDVGAEATDFVSEEPVDADTAGEAEFESFDTAQPAEAADAAFEDQARPSARPALEERITSRWMVWLGALAIALAGVFLVKYASDSGYLGPGVRVIMGLFLGAALAFGGEWVRRHPEHGRYLQGEGSYIAPALTAAGIFIAFTSTYAGYALYDLIPSLVAFAALAAISFLAFALALLQGPFVALVGLLGGYVAPLLVTTQTPSVWGFFAYLAALGAACFALLRYRQWWWLSHAAVAGAVFWILLWLIVEHTVAHALPVGLYLLALLGAALYFWRGYPPVAPDKTGFKRLLALSGRELASVVGGVAVAAMLPLYAEASHFHEIALAVAVAGCVLCGLRAREAQTAELLLPVFALSVLALLALWHPAVDTDTVGVFPLPGGARIFGPVLAPDLVGYALAAALFAAVFGAGGYVGMWQGRTAAIWAGVSAATPVAVLVLSWFRISDRVADVSWSLMALVLAALFAAAASRLRPHIEDKARATALALYAAGTVAALAFAAAMMFERAMLTVALSLMLPALAWIDSRLSLTVLRRLAAVVAAVVLARLALNWNVLDYPLNVPLGSHWILYGYGVPALAFFAGARMFKAMRDDRIVALLEGGGVLFATLLISLEIRVLVEGSLAAERYGLFEASLHTLSWLIVGMSRVYACAREPRTAALWSARVAIGLAGVQLVLGHLIALNPVLTQDPVGSVAVFNVLALAYAAPAIILAAGARYLGAIGFGVLTRPAFGLGFVLFFVYLTLEVQRMFQGPVLAGAPQSDAETYAYSVVWLLFALALLVGGIWSGRAALRYGALVALLVTVLKVFLYDMADLEGLFKVASFLGLGLCLVGIGYVYRRYVFPSGNAPPNADDSGGNDAAEEGAGTP